MRKKVSNLMVAVLVPLLASCSLFGGSDTDSSADSSAVSSVSSSVSSSTDNGSASSSSSEPAYAAAIEAYYPFSTSVFTKYLGEGN